MKKIAPACLVAASASLFSVAHAAESTAEREQRLEQQVGQMQQQLATMLQELQRLKTQNEALAAQQRETAAQAQAAAQAPAAPPPAPPVASGISPNLGLWGYGEIYAMNPVHDSARAQADLARAVFGIGYRFDDNTTFNSEFEVEQFYIDHQITPTLGAKAGLFLMPFGLLNEHHEPTNFYGVQRNFVETLIIPSTWREGGLSLHGNNDLGIGWDVGITTGLNLAGWNNSPEDPQYRTALELEDSDIAPMQAMHQELQMANIQHLSQYASLNYSGVPKLLLGGAVFTGKTALPQIPAGLPDSRVTLWEAHARWTPGKADISAVYAQGTISNTATYNLANAGVSNPIPSKFLGYYVQAAYDLWGSGSYRLKPFLRWEHYDMGASYEGIAQGTTTTPTGLASDGKPWPQPNDRVWTVGANFYLNPQVVLKVDYQHFAVNPDLSRLDFGLGVSF